MDAGTSPAPLVLDLRCQVIVAGIGALAPLGFGIALHVRCGRPILMWSTYCDAWRAHYRRHSYAMRDPAIIWGLRHTGVIAWADLEGAEQDCVLRQARAFGLMHGIVLSVGSPYDRSIMGLARADRPFHAGEKAHALELLRKLHDETRSKAILTESQIEALRLVAGGMRYAAAAHALKISESAFKARLRSARSRFGAKTTAEVILHAQLCNLL